MAEAAAELSAGAMAIRTRRPGWHVHCNPAHHDPRVRPTFWKLLEEEFGLQHARYYGREHEKGSRPNHEHRVYDATTLSGHVVDFSYERMRREKVSVKVAHCLGLPMPPVPHTRSIARALRAEGHHDIADWVDEHHHKPVAVAGSTPQVRQIEARTGRALKDVEDAALEAWTQSDDDLSFRAALASRGLFLAMGNSEVVIVDGPATWPCARAVSAASRRAGSRIRNGLVKLRLKALDLPSVDQLRQLAASPDMAAVRGRLRALRDATSRVEQERAALAWAEPSADVVAAAETAADREAAETHAQARLDRTKKAVRAIEQSAPATAFARLLDRLLWPRRAARRTALSAAKAATAKAQSDLLAASVLKRSARRRADEAERTWREKVASDTKRLLKRHSWLETAVRVIERRPELAAVPDEVLSVEVQRMLRPARRSQPLPFEPRRFTPSAPAYRPRL